MNIVRLGRRDKMGELQKRLVEPYLASLDSDEPDWISTVDPLEIKKVIDEMTKEIHEAWELDGKKADYREMVIRKWLK